MKERWARLTLGLLLALKIAALFALAWNRRIVMDEFAQLGWAKYLGHGLYSTIWPTNRWALPCSSISPT